ncbi:Tumor susceptibility protein 101 protein [Nymphon striatum]|nr:Tumor susceptibility protein 101 protein [Nymphon striatum]
MPRSATEAVLSQSSRKYLHHDSVRRDVLNALQHYNGLTLKLTPFVFNDGSEKELLNFDGTIPVPFKGNIYNIPISIWLLENHPYSPPMCFVRPTQTMQIKVSRHVDQTGKIYLPYLHEWKHGSSDLLGLIQVMIIVFGEQPPVYSRASGQQPQNTGGHHFPPYPGSNPILTVRQDGSEWFVFVSAKGLTFLKSVIMNHNHAVIDSIKGYMPGQMPNMGVNANSQRTPYPQYPMNTSGGNSGYPPTSYPSYPPSTQSNYNSGYQSYPAYPPSTTTSSYPMPSTVSGYPPYPSTTTTPVTNINKEVQSEKEERLIQLSAVENKLRERLDETFSQMQAELDVLKKTRTDLNNGQNRLKEINQKLQNEHNQLDQNIRILKEKNSEMQEILEKMDQQGEIDIDDAVTTTAPLYKQLLNLYAEENATQDTIYYLGEGLRRGMVDLDVYLKHVRELSRKQFMLRALMQICREKAGLPF